MILDYLAFKGRIIGLEYWSPKSKFSADVFDELLELNRLLVYLLTNRPKMAFLPRNPPSTHDGLLFAGYKASFADYDQSNALVYWNVINYITQENCTIALGTNSDTSLNSYTTCEGVSVQTDDCYTSVYDYSKPKHASSRYSLCDPVQGPNGQERYLRGSWGIFADSKQQEKASAFLTYKL